MVALLLSPRDRGEYEKIRVYYYDSPSSSSSSIAREVLLEGGVVVSHLWPDGPWWLKRKKTGLVWEWRLRPSWKLDEDLVRWVVQMVEPHRFIDGHPAESEGQGVVGAGQA